jgi:hypothetical protein
MKLPPRRLLKSRRKTNVVKTTAMISTGSLRIPQATTAAKSMRMTITLTMRDLHSLKTNKPKSWPSPSSRTRSSPKKFADCKDCFLEFPPLQVPLLRRVSRLEFP